MAMKKLPNSIQSVFSASIQINSYKKAIEELIYNSLDAEALSIAIRVNIEENTIQVIDNGCGVAKSNFYLLGQQYTTSRCIDLEVLKSAPNKYGFRGQSLASIIEVSQNVTITSRCENVDETWVKVFHKRKETELFQTTQRPSKGTTVEIKGFLYNLNIQKRVINPLNELNDIKSFLEKLSLVHSNISLSLRDEPKNEIVFKLHKNRDIYQTLSSLFGVDKNDVQELKVEKNQYKVTAYIGKNKDANHQYWIYLNGKLVHNSKLHKVINDNLVKALGLRFNQSTKKVKSKNAHYEEENVSSRNKIPFYFIFINCPYYDYDVIYGPKESVVEFKNWEPVNKLLDKLIKFYIGDMNLKEVAKSIQNKLQSKEKEAETRDQVKKIMERILRSNPKKLGVSQMQNGIRGKLIKRKTKKKPLKLTLTKIIPPKTKEGIITKKTDDIRIDENADFKNYEDVSVSVQQNSTYLDCNDIKINKPIEIVEGRNTAAIMEEKKHAKLSKKKNKNDKVTSDKKTENYKQKRNIITSKKPKKPVKNGNHKIYKTTSTKQPQKTRQVVRKSSKKKKVQDPIISNFLKATASIKQRCNMLATKANELMTYKDKPKRQVFINETVQYSSVIRNNKNVSIRKKVGEVIIQDYIPLPPKFNACSFDYRVCDRLKTKTNVSTYDLVHTILKSQQKDNIFNGDTKKPFKTPKTATERIYYDPVLAEPVSPTIPEFARETYESHNYIEVRNRPREYNDFDSHTKKPRNKQFITKQSRDNFITVKDRANVRYKPKTCRERPTLISMFNLVDKDSYHYTPYTIEFSNSNEKKMNDETIVTNGLVLFRNQYKNGTYTIEKENKLTQFLSPSKIDDTYTVTATEKSPRDDCKDDPQIHAGSEENADWYCSRRSINVQQSTRSIFFTQRYVENITSLGNEGHDNETENIEQNHRVASLELREGNIEIPNPQSQPLDNLYETNLCSHDNKHNSNNHILSWNDSLLNNLFEDSKERCNESLFNNEFEINSLLCDRNVYSNISKESQVMEGFNKLKQLTDPPNPDLYSKNVIGLDRNSKNNYEYLEQHIPYSNEIDEDNVTNLAEQTMNIEIPTINRENGTKDGIYNQTNHFTFKNRHRFVPKGMSPIFENCQSRLEYNYNPDNDYYEKTLYYKFANDVQINSEIFEPRVQNVNELTTRDIEKVNNRLIKDNASLTFNGETLKQANVLGQVDDKFIAAKIKGKSHQSQDLSEFLVLFDQHAVHERIRLENNLKDYLQDDKWKSITLDDISLKLSKDEILYLHNYKDKFTQFGLHWTVLNSSEVSIHAIPEAALGKNPRQVEVVIKAVRSLISEEIHAIKSQKGCVTLYPKSIMDLIFSEACRYAIKFGDRLSKQACMELLSSLSKCKTPFQCAHGRPVMAVLVEVKTERRKYELTLPEVHKFARCSKKRIK